MAYRSGIHMRDKRSKGERMKRIRVKKKEKEREGDRK